MLSKRNGNSEQKGWVFLASFAVLARPRLCGCNFQAFARDSGRSCGVRRGARMRSWAAVCLQLGIVAILVVIQIVILIVFVVVSSREFGSLKRFLVGNPKIY